MASTYTTNLGIEKIATGEQSGTWGATTNTNLDLIDQAVNGVVQITVAATGSTGSPEQLTITNGSASDGRNKFIDFYSPTDLGGTVYYQLDPNDAEKIVFVRNSLGGGQTLVLFQGTYNASNDVEVPNGVDMLVKFDGTGASATVTNVFEKLQVNALSVNDGNITNVGDIALDSISADGTDINVSVSDNSATALTVKEGSNTYLTIDTTDSAEKVLVSKTLDVGDNNITNVGNIALDSISADGTQIDIDITDNTASAFTISEGANNYIEITTTDGSELITVSKNSTFAGTTIADLGVVTTVDINGGTIDGVTIGGASAGAITGTTITGTSFVSSGDININSALPKIQFTDTTGSQQSRLILNDDEIQLDNQSTGGIRLRTDNFKSRFLIASNGDISFYEDTGTTPKLFWDASTERLGIGNVAPTTALDVTGTATATIVKSLTGGIAGVAEAARFGASGNGGSGRGAKIIIGAAGSASSVDVVELIGYQNAASATADNAAFAINVAAVTTGTLTERLRIDSSGNVGIGTVSPANKLHISDSTDITMNGSAAGQFRISGLGYSVAIALDDTASYIYNNGSSRAMVFGTNETERMRISANGSCQWTPDGTTADMTLDASGNLGIGTASPEFKADFIVDNGDAIAVRPATATLNATQTALRLYGHESVLTSRYVEIASVNGAGTDANNMVFKTGSGATVAEAMRIDPSGNLLVGSDIYAIAVQNTEEGVVLDGANGRIYATANAHHDFNITADGEIFRFRSATVAEGNISVSGTTVSYNGGHLSRWSQLLDNSRDETIVKGTVMTNLDEMAVWSHDAVEAQDAVYDEDGNIITEAVEAKQAYTEENEQLNKMAVSSIEGDANVSGVFVNWDEDDDMNIAMTGDMVIRIAQGTTVQRGDLLMSAGDGTAKPQGDDIVRSKTIAKVTSTHVSHTYADGSYCVPCVLMAC
jgi:hypothetical protein